MKRTLTAAAVTLMAGFALAAPVSAQTFYNICAERSATFKVCASAEVFITDGNVLNFKVWNMNAVAEPGSTAEAYADEFGGWHTIAAVGISNINYSPEQGDYLMQARHYHADGAYLDASGSRYDVLTHWASKAEIKNDGTADADMLQIYNTGADTEGHKEGIAGCLDPDLAGTSNHVQTCNSYPGESYVLFQITGFTEISLDGAIFEFHSRQVANAQCDVNNWTDACTEDSLKGSGPPTEVVPEPISMILLGSGLLGVGGAARRRRRLHLAE